MTANMPAAQEPAPAVAELPADVTASEVQAADLDLMVLRHRMAVGQGPFNFLAMEEQLQPTARTSKRARQAARSN